MSEIDEKLNIVEEETLQQKDDKAIQKEDLDASFKRQKKKHRNILSKYDHVFKLLSHPLVWSFIVSVSFLLFVIVRYIRVFKELASFTDALKVIETDIKTMLSYFGTVIITHIITKYLDSYHK